MRIALLATVGALVLSLPACGQDTAAPAPVPAPEAVVETVVDAVADAIPAPVAAPAIAAPSGLYVMDDTHAAVTFKIMHLGLSPYTARFNTVNGELQFDAEAPQNSTVSATISAASVDTDFTGSDRETVEEWTAKLIGFIGGVDTPDITFTSTSANVTGEGVGSVTGDLTLNGVTKPVTLNVTLTGALAKHPFAAGGALGFTATGAIKRSDFGILQGSGLDGALGDTVEIELFAEFAQKV